ncbi:CheY chemotaxis protein or a CheY-like REC (receiver) domain [Fulvimarina manganoxydans]|uniref:CheY chemotaxis protein or a CheY-like REC (Receiver) domain n=1 Tax=Fulvimarina manganoxydans TaxID=937218 RepID=A0A1W2DE81_9HYPH|nr:response regulator [Fulvimarina manganoxydans]SMC95791.1 CheY chemotaxis protein or a CheY-like REC (receiver) domain [Fulvimarina manganoxydans]
MRDGAEETPMPTCLCFDEMPIVRKVAPRILAKLGVETDCFETLSEAEAAHREKGGADLIILSATGGNQAVFDFVRTIRLSDAGREAVILVSLVERNIGMQMKVRRSGANGVLMKPFDADGFRETISLFMKSRVEEAA